MTPANIRKYVRLMLSVAMGLVVAAPALAGQSTYVNGRFGTSCTFPDDVFVLRQPEPDNGDGQRWLSADGASLVCSGMFNVTDDTPKTRIAAEKASQNASYSITYSKAGRDWAVLSGFRYGKVFYHRLLFGDDDVVHGVWIDYPQALKAKYDPLVGKIAGSLKGP